MRKYRIDNNSDKPGEGVKVIQRIKSVQRRTIS